MGCVMKRSFLLSLILSVLVLLVPDAAASTNSADPNRQTGVRDCLYVPGVSAPAAIPPV